MTSTALTSTRFLVRKDKLETTGLNSAPPKPPRRGCSRSGTKAPKPSRRSTSKGDPRIGHILKL